MATRYNVRIKDTAGAQVALLTTWVRLEYTKRVNGVDYHVLTIDGGSDTVDLIDLDSQIEVWHRDIASDPVIPWYLDYEGFHRTQTRETLANGDLRFTSFGAGYDMLLEGRHILYAAGSAGAVKATAPGETQMKAFVNENAGPGATSPPRLLSSGVTSGLTIQGDGAAGANWEGGRAYRNLLDVLIEIAEATGVDFVVVGTGAATFEFQAQLSPIGDDRSTTGLDPTTGLNGAGNAPVIFSTEFGNMANPRYTESRRQERNAVIVLGQGIEADRTVAEEADAAAIAESPWNRREVTRQATQESAAAGLTAVGDALLDELAAKETFTFDVLQVPGTLYGREYFWGDIITARYQDIEVNRKIVGVRVTVERGRENIEIEMGDDT